MLESRLHYGASQTLAQLSCFNIISIQALVLVTHSFGLYCDLREFLLVNLTCLRLKRPVCRPYLYIQIFLLPIQTSL